MLNELSRLPDGQSVLTALTVCPVCLTVSPDCLTVCFRSIFICCSRPIWRLFYTDDDHPDTNVVTIPIF